MRIIQLPDSLANKIAAGEVVERPASVVKELIENSIDANSTWIQIHLTEAGLDQIRVIDNGDGIKPSDCEKAFKRHATSKIASESDLFHLKTLGFRGEALASIASVSRLTIKTSQGVGAGVELTLEGGHVIAQNKSDARKGTEITVRNLFFNTPARLKYMKTIHTELGHVTDVINRIAFAHTDIRIDVTHNGKKIFQTPGTKDLLQVISQVYGTNVARKMIPIKEETLDYQIRGYISEPEVTRASRSYMTTIINGRYIRHMGLSQAILRGYHTLLPTKRFPITVLQINMDPILVDVNVHPAKLEARFSKEKELFHAIEQLIRKTFRNETLIPKGDIPKHREQPKTEQVALAFEKTKTPKKSMYKNKSDQKQNQSHTLSQKDTQVQEKTHQTIKHIHEKKTRNQRIPMMYPVGQVQGTYIVAQNEHGMYLIDQHAAQERIKYEFYKQKFGQVHSETQELLIPIRFDVSPKEALFIEQNIDKLAKIGIFLHSFGPQSFIIRSHPTWFPKGFEEEAIRDIVEQIIEDEQIDVEKIREEAAILMACKRSIKANQYLTKDDMEQLLTDLRKTADPFTCPHGRPIIIHFSSYDLEKMFKRVM